MYPTYLQQNIIITRGIKYYYVLFFCLSVLQFFQPVKINQSLLYYIYYALFSATVLFILFSYKSTYNNSFTRPILLLVSAVIISGFLSSYYWEQSLIDSIKALSLYLCYILFFLLSILKLRIREVEGIFIVMAVLYILVFIITFLSFPVQIFGEIQKYGDERGFQRITVIGIGFLFLFSFYLLNQIIKQHKVCYILLFFITLVLIFLSLSRIIITASIIVFSLFILRKSSNLKKMLAIFIIGCFIFLFSKTNSYKLMLSQTQEQTKYINEDIRIQAAYYYLNNFSQNTLTKIFGNGQAYYGNKYANSIGLIERGYGFYAVDVGYIGLYAKFGIFAILAYLIIIYKTLKVSIPEEYLYCKYFLYFVFIISIIVDATYNISFIPAIVISLYILSSQERKPLKELNQQSSS